MSENYYGNPLLKKPQVKTTYTKDQINEYVKCVNNPVYFIENYIKIVHLDRGMINFEMYPFQKKIVETINSNRFVICKIPRQSGKSICIISYVLYYILFNPKVSVAILANKLQTARELLDRLKFAYENLPRWMQQGIVEWNKLSIQIENGSKVVASATSMSAIRGQSHNLIVLDEFAYISTNMADAFFSSVYPTISSGKTSKMVIISTPKGLNHFYKIWVNALNKKNGYIPIEAHWHEVPGRDQKFKEETIANTSEAQWRVEFECVGADSMITVIDKETNQRHTVRIKDFYDFFLEENK